MDEITEMMVEDFFASRTQIEYECNHQEENEHYIMGKCVYCKGAIYADDVDYVLNEEEETGICNDCLRDKCVWRG